MFKATPKSTGGKAAKKAKAPSAFRDLWMQVCTPVKRKRNRKGLSASAGTGCLRTKPVYMSRLFYVPPQSLMLAILVVGFLIGIWRLVIDGILRSTWNYRHVVITHPDNSSRIPTQPAS